MPTKRKRFTHGSGLTDEIIGVLGVGTGINHMPDAELRELWHQWGPKVTRYWSQRFGHEPFVALIAREENWDAHETK